MPSPNELGPDQPEQDQTIIHRHDAAPIPPEFNQVFSVTLYLFTPSMTPFNSLDPEVLAPIADRLKSIFEEDETIRVAGIEVEYQGVSADDDDDDEATDEVSPTE